MYTFDVMCLVERQENLFGTSQNEVPERRILKGTNFYGSDISLDSLPYGYWTGCRDDTPHLPVHNEPNIIFTICASTYEREGGSGTKLRIQNLESKSDESLRNPFRKN